jgi:hypothetical protein
MTFFMADIFLSCQNMLESKVTVFVDKVSKNKNKNVKLTHKYSPTRTIPHADTITPQAVAIVFGEVSPKAKIPMLYYNKNC